MCHKNVISFFLYIYFLFLEIRNVVETFISVFRLCDVVVVKSVAIYIFVVLKVFG